MRRFPLSRFIVCALPACSICFHWNHLCLCWFSRVPPESRCATSLLPRFQVQSDLLETPFRSEGALERSSSGSNSWRETGPAQLL